MVPAPRCSSAAARLAALQLAWCRRAASLPAVSEILGRHVASAGGQLADRGAAPSWGAPAARLLFNPTQPSLRHPNMAPGRASSLLLLAALAVVSLGMARWAGWVRCSDRV